MTPGEIACLWTIGLSASACGWMAFGIGPVLVASGVILFAWWAVPAWIQRRRLNRCIRQMRAAWEENKDATGGVL